MKQDRSGSTGKTIRSVETTLSVLEVIRRRETAGVTEIAGEVDCSKSTVHHHVSTLRDAGYLERVDGRYRLSLRFLSLGGQVLERKRLFHLAKDDVDELAQGTGEQSRLIVEDNGLGVTLYQAAGAHGSVTDTHVGSTEDLYCTAAGKAFLAELSAETVETYVETNELLAHTTNTITDLDTLREELEAINSRGVAFDDQERYEGVRCVASAVESPSGDLLGAISVSAPVDRMGEDRFQSEIPDRIQNVTGVVEINTAYSDWTGDFAN